MSNEFVNGLKIETKTGQYGEFMKCSINLEEIFNNPLNNDKWLNFMIFKSKAGNWYSKISKNKVQKNNENIVDFNEINDEDIPF